MDMPYGFHPDMWKPYINACFKAGINPEFGTKPNGTKGSRIMQTIGTASASQGYHASDGTYLDTKGVKHFYTAAIDIRSTDLNHTEIEKFWKALIENEFACWWRHEDSFAHNQHFHVNYCGVVMKAQLRAQCSSFFKRKSGLVINKIVPFLVTNLSDSQIEISKKLFLAKNKLLGAEMTEEDLDTILEALGDEDCSCGFDPSDVN